MDNVIQQIKIEDIVPSNHNYNLVDIKVLEDLAISIKNNGIKEPLRLKKTDDKYKIISGNKRYRAAILAGLSEVPAIIDNYDNEYIKINDTSYLHSINNNSDIVNLSELNKEYERDDFKMNNELMNNNNIMPEQPQTISNAAPTFGGRFFPSLEDEPTNMAFNTVIEPTPGTVQGQQPTNNFIDLTDNSNSMPSQTMAEPIINMPMDEQQTQPTIAPQPEFNNGVIPQTNGSIIDIASLTQNNSMVSPVQETPIPANIDNNFQEVISDFQPIQQPEMSMSQMQPTIDPMMSTNPIEFNQNPIMPEQPQLNIQPEAVINPMEQVISTMPSVDPMMNNQINMVQDQIVSPVEPVIQNPIQENINVPNMDMMQESINQMPNFDMSMVKNVQEPIVQEPILMEQVVEPIVGSEMVNESPQKDILPVINTLKAVGVNLENFGYTIRITDEDLPNSYKITIEIDK